MNIYSLQIVLQKYLITTQILHLANVSLQNDVTSFKNHLGQTKIMIWVWLEAN